MCIEPVTLAIFNEISKEYIAIAFFGKILFVGYMSLTLFAHKNKPKVGVCFKEFLVRLGETADILVVCLLSYVENEFFKWVLVWFERIDGYVGCFVGDSDTVWLDAKSLYYILLCKFGRRNNLTTGAGYNMKHPPADKLLDMEN
ncbi:hypothetical protein D9M68_641730 [compost metagenome]